jgi:5'-nucleotidase
MIGTQCTMFVAWSSLLAAMATTLGTGEFRFTVLHTNDLHSHYDETCGGGGGPCVGGFARLRGALDAERAEAAADGRPAIYLHAGDTFQGTRFYSELRWEPAADFMGDLGADAMVRTRLRARVGSRFRIYFFRQNES